MSATAQGAPVAALLGQSAEPVLAWLLESGEPYAEWVTRALVLGEPDDAPAVLAARAAVLADPGVREIVDSLPAWDAPEHVSGHHSPAYLPNRLNLLADMGVRGGDFAEVEERLDAFLGHQHGSGRFEAFGEMPGRPKPEWGSMLCDTNVITDLLLRFGRGGDSRVSRALDRLQADATRTPQGRAWQCVPAGPGLWRGPGRKADVCPQVTLEGLRALSHLPESGRPAWIVEAARTPLEVWRRRATERPYQFGHGYQFKSVKWPNFWYDVLWVLETVGRFPALWRGSDAREEDRVALVELAACLLEYDFDADGRVTPRRTYRGFERFSFGRKDAPSPFATARCLVALLRLADLAEEIAALDVASLPSSRGPADRPVPPRSPSPFRRAPAACPVAPSARTTAIGRRQAVAHVLTRQHLASRGEAASVESVVADLVGLHANSQTSPYVSLHARLPGFTNDALDRALYDRRSLVKYRCMRGALFVVRRELLPVLAAATGPAVTRHARRHAEFRGVDAATYERLVPRVLALLDHGPLPSAEIRTRLGTHAEGDIAAAVNLMAAEGLVLRDRPVGAWHERRATFTPLATALPDLRLDSVRETDAIDRLVRAYVRGFGPVTVHDASWWLGVGKRRVSNALERLEGEIVEVRLEGSETTHLLHAADLDDLATASLGEEPHVRLLPALDSLTMGYALRSRLLAEEHAPYVFDRSHNVPPVILVDGAIRGVWDAAGPDAEPEVLVHLFDGPGAPDELLEAVSAQALATGRFWFAEDARVTRVSSMMPLIDRPIGAFLRPLRP